MKWKLGLLIVLLLCAVMAPLTASAETSGDDGNIHWVLSDDGVLTISGNGPMTNYDEDAPWGRTMTGVIMENGVTSIGGWAFSYCSSLTSIALPDSVTSIGGGAFYGCSSLTSIALPDSVTSIGGGAFSDCSSLTSITIPEGVTSIGEKAFSYCSSLTSITIPEGVINIGEYAFSGCSAVRYAVIGSDGAKALGQMGYSFRDNQYPKISLCYDYNNGEISNFSVEGADQDIETVVFPEGVTSISDSAFSGCSNLTSITIPDGVTSIGSSAFDNCSSLTSITIPDGVTSIGSSAFDNCSSLTSIALPDSVTSIGGWAFSGCSSLTSITIPDSVTSIGSSAFYGCNSLTSITISEGVINIGAYAFSNCSSLTSITIPDSVTSIGNYAFQYCSKLTKVLFYGNTTAFGGSPFVNISPKPTIYCYEYSDADGWATENQYPLVYLDNLNLDDARSISLQDNFRLPCGQSKSIGVNTFPDEAHPDITWASSAPDIVTVDENGIATAIAPGTAIITATMGNLFDTVEITAYVKAEDFTLNTSEIWVIAKETAQLTAEEIPIGGEISYTWSSSDAAIASVSPDGLVTTKKPGDVIITVNSDLNIQKECLVHSCYPVTEIAFTEDQAIAIAGIPLQLTANVTMRTQNCVNHLVTFTSSDDTVATVDENGLVTPLQEGAVTITATAGSGVTASITVNVIMACEEHVPSAIPAVSPTCMEPGLTEGVYCERCGEMLIAQEEVPALGHEETIDEAVEPTCTEPGLTEGTHCERCGEVLLSQEEIPALGHDWSEPEYAWAEDFGTVTASRVCNRDGAHIETETVSVMMETTATCTEDGISTYTSHAFSNPAFVIQHMEAETPALGHDSITDPARYVTCTEPGLTEGSHCQRCGEILVAQEEIPAPGHDMTQWQERIAPGEGGSVYGMWIRTCIICGHVEYYTGETAPCDQHIPEEKVVQEPTCTQPGIRKIVCSVCGTDMSGAEEIPPLGHDWDAWAILAGASEDSNRFVRWCKRCMQAEMKMASEPPLAEGENEHTPEEIILSQPTCTESGRKQVICAVCSAQLSLGESIPALGHDWGEATYTWSASNDALTASHVCKRDPAHSETETVPTARSIVSPTMENKGKAMYASAAFENASFGAQLLEITLPALGQLQLLRLPSALTTIEDEAFSGAAFEAAIIPNGCTAIGSRAFANCPNLIYVRIPASVTSIAEDAFEGCSYVVIDRVE